MCLPAKYEFIHELLLEQAENLSKSVDNWTAFLKTSAYMFKYPFEDQLLIHAQRPDATACATLEIWNNRLKRWRVMGSKGIALLNENQTLRYVFDVKDTRSPNSRPFRIWKVDINDKLEYIEMINNKYGSIYSTSDLGQAILEMSSIIVEDNYQDYLTSLIKFNENSDLELIDENEIGIGFKSLLTNSIAYEIIYRCGIDVKEYFSRDDFTAIRHYNSLDTIMQLGTATHDLCEIGMRDISRKAKEIMIRTFEKEKEKRQNKDIQERSEYYERNHVHKGGRLFDAESEKRGGDLQQQIRKTEIQLSQEQISGTSAGTQSQEHSERASENDRQGSKSEDGYSDEPAIGSTASTRQDETSVRMGKPYEQSESTSRGNNFKGDHLQLDLGLGGEELQNTLPPFDLSDLPQLLREDVSLQHSRKEIQQFFIDHPDENERAEYLEECYDDTLVQTFRHPENFDYSYLGYKRSGHGLEVWSGNYLNQTSKSFLSFFQIQSEIEKLIQKDTYLIPRWSEMTPIQKTFYRGVINRNVEFHLFSYKKDFKKTSAEIIEFFESEQNAEKRVEYVKEIFPDHIVEIEAEGVHMGFEKKEEHLHIYMGTYDEQRDSVNYVWEIVERDIGGMILSRYFDPAIQIPTAEDQRTAIYENEEAFKNGRYFSQEEVDRILIRGSGFEDGKFRIYEQFTKQASINQNAIFLKNEYGIGGAHPAFGFIDEDYDSKGITLTKSTMIGANETSYTIKWKNVAKRISQLISLDRYLSPAEKEKYPQYLNRQIEKQLEYERRQMQTNMAESADEDYSISAPSRKEYQWKIGDTFYKGIDE